MSAEDEMRAQKITFIPRIKLSLKTSLNSMLTGEQRVARLGTRVEILPPPPHTSPSHSHMFSKADENMWEK